MPSLTNLVQQLAEPEALFTAWAGWPEPASIAALARLEFEAVTLDMQHGMIDFMAVCRAIPLIVAADKPAIVRIPVGEFQTASRVLDAGAAAVIAPMVNSAEDARALVRFTKFPPLGERSWGPYAAAVYADLTPDRYLAEANRFSLAFAMIETREALAALDAILAVDGIDGVFVGPSDLSIALSSGAFVDPGHAEVDVALAFVIERCRAARKFAGVYAGTPERARDLAALGYDLIAITGEASLLASGARHMLDQARGI